MPDKPKREWIPTSIRRELLALPCAICGVPYFIHCDHIVPVARGGRSVRENLQPLCRDCNLCKKHLRTNAEVRLVIAGRGYSHFLQAVFRFDTRHVNDYDGPTLSAWCAANPEKVTLATDLYLRFIEGGALA